MANESDKFPLVSGEYGITGLNKIGKKLRGGFWSSAICKANRIPFCRESTKIERTDKLFAFYHNRYKKGNAID